MKRFIRDWLFFLIGATVTLLIYMVLWSGQMDRQVSVAMSLHKSLASLEKTIKLLTKEIVDLGIPIEVEIEPIEWRDE